MRSDIAKLTTEHERRSGTGESKKYGGKIKVVHNSDHEYEEEYGGFRSSSRRRAYGYNYKEFSDVLNPLRGALRANLGRPWNDVYSEFCQHLDRRSVAGIHIFGHLCGRNGAVITNGLYVDEGGNVCKYPDGGYFGPSVKMLQREIDGFYVHPVTGILCYKSKRPRAYNSHKMAVLRSSIEIDGHNFEVIDGNWFETWYTLTTKFNFHPCYIQDKNEEWFKDRGYVKHPKTGIWGYWKTIYNQPELARKRSLSKKEIKATKRRITERIKELEES